MNTAVHFSSESNEWATPQEFFDQLHAVHHFTLDPCATPENAKCIKYFTEAQDGLKQSWANETVFMNPPYGREIGKWMQKAYNEARNNHATVVCLVPSRTDTQWFHRYAMKGTVAFIEGRLKFGGHKNAAPFPSALVTFHAGIKTR